MTLLLTQHWRPGSTDRTTPEIPDEEGRPGAFAFRVHNLGDAELRIRRLCYASMTRPGKGVRISGAQMTGRLANHVELSADVTLPPGGTWDILIEGLTHAPLNRSQGAMAAWVDPVDGPPIPVRCEDLRADAPAGPRKDWPAGEITQPLALLPWPAEAAVTEWCDAGPFAPGDIDPAAFETVAALHHRLFPEDAPALSHAGGIPVDAAVGDARAGGYRLTFGARVTLIHADEDGLRHGLVALAQIAHGAQVDPRFRLPAAGQISDAPRFDWRGMHVDVARNFRPLDDLYRMADILAWHRMSHFHLHLTDDEAWRLESRAFPELTRVGAQRTRGTGLPPQYADGLDGQKGHYTVTEMAGLIAHCTNLGIEVVPELDTPGHTHALMQAINGLHDQSEPWDNYRSVQGYPNNALNPALPRTYEVMETLIDEVCALFPSSVIHMGGDEVDPRAWSQSPVAQRLRAQQGLAEGAMPLQSYFMRQMQGLLAARGRRMGGWDECAEGGGVPGALLFAWRNVDKTRELLAEGYEVIATPGQAYYLDMIQGAGWDEPGTSWAGAVSPRQTYDFEVLDDPGVVGVQGCIWSEHLATRSRWNYMVFPRLSAVAEAAWTPPSGKDWSRFCALSRLMPQL